MVASSTVPAGILQLPILKLSIAALLIIAIGFVTLSFSQVKTVDTDHNPVPYNSTDPSFPSSIFESSSDSSPLPSETGPSSVEPSSPSSSSPHHPSSSEPKKPPTPPKKCEPVLKHKGVKPLPLPGPTEWESEPILHDHSLTGPWLAGPVEKMKNPDPDRLSNHVAFGSRSTWDSKDPYNGFVPPSTWPENPDVIFTFTLMYQPDPQGVRKPCHTTKCMMDYISLWYNSVVDLNLPAVVFYDGPILSKEVLDCYQVKNVAFVNIQDEITYAVKNYRKSINDSRFIVMLNWLLKHGNPMRYVIMTDCRDVRVERDPFDMMRRRKENLFFGSEPVMLEKNGWMTSNIKICFAQTWDEIGLKGQLINAGITGGYINNYIQWLRSLGTVLMTLKNVNCDMMGVNYVTRMMLSEDQYFTGYPLHSKFRGFEFGSNAALIHK